MEAQVREFFKHHLLSWLEVLSFEGSLHTAIYSLHNVRLRLADNPSQDLLDLIDDCERFVLRSFDVIEQSAMHIYHSALSWAPTSSPTRQLYETEIIADVQVLNAVGTTRDACVRIVPVGEGVKTVVFSHNGALLATRGRGCVKVFDVMTGVNQRRRGRLESPMLTYLFT